MTRDPAAQAVHERLEHVVAAMPDPDVEAGWAALVAQLEPPVAPVVPIRRRRRPWRGAVVGVAAAIAIAGAAFAAVHHAGAEQPVSRRPNATSLGQTGIGPHAHRALSGPPPEPQPAQPVPRHHHHTTTTTPGGPTHPTGGSGGAPSGSAHHDTQPSHHDSPNDTDHGTGNDGSHDDNGQGNNTQGQDSQGGGSNGGSGNDQGSASGQGSGDRGTHGSGGGEHPSGNSGSDGDHGSSSQGGGQGSNH